MTTTTTYDSPDLLIDDVSESIVNDPLQDFFATVRKRLSPEEVLNDHFGYTSFRLEQEAIIKSILEKKDTLALMPTGGGKSLCYQIPALIFEGLTLVISPLIALMKDQVDALRLNGIPAAYLNSTQDFKEQEEILDQAKSGQLKLLYLAPERLIRMFDTSASQITDLQISLVAIDEAHCISHWGHDFRPEYLMLARLKENFPDVPVIALTATADRLTRKDIIEKLRLNDAAVFISSFNRSNICYTVEPKRGSFEKLLHFLEKYKDDSGIIYCLSRASTERLAGDLFQKGYKALAYHAGMDRAQRTANQERFLRDEVKIIVATIAFGMGIDKSNVRYVVHMDLPKNIESYYQETGRAGRDGLESEALLFYTAADVRKMKGFVEIDDNPEQTEIYLKKLDQMGRYGELTTCRRKYLLNYFDEETSTYCGNCDVCLTRFEQFDGTIPAQKALSAVVRLREQYGAGYVIDFLRGSASARIRDEHRELKTFGVGKDLTKDEWNNIIRELVTQGFLIKASGIYPVLRLTRKGYDVLKGQEKVMIAKAKERIQAKSEMVTAHEKDLLVELKELRQHIALEENVPVHIVLSDVTLLDLATRLPLNLSDFWKISGFSQMKVQRYGRRFWQVITAYCKEHNLSTRIYLTASGKRRRRTTATRAMTYNLFKTGHSIPQIAALRKLSTGTIQSHLEHFIEKGQLKVEQVVDSKRIATIREAIEKMGGDRLNPVKEYLGEDFNYGEIRLVRASVGPPTP